jgi:hypothetical protein
MYPPPPITYICFQNVLFRAPSRNEVERFARRRTGVNERDKLWEMKRKGQRGSVYV